MEGLYLCWKIGIYTPWIENMHEREGVFYSWYIDQDHDE